MESFTESLFEDLSKRLAQAPLLAGLNLPKLAQPSIRLVARRAPVETGASRIGGEPDVPPGFEWPRWTPPVEQERGLFGWLKKKPSATSRPLGFIAQLDLSAIPRVDDSLPNSGWLYFFYDTDQQTWGFDPADRGSCRIFYANCDRSTLRRMAPPNDANPDFASRSCAVAAIPELTLPEELSGVEYETPTYEAYQKLLAELSHGKDTVSDTIHRLLGHPQPIQGEMELECQHASNGINSGGVPLSAHESARAKELESGATDWRLLLQIDTDEEGPGWMWGDVGRIYFWILKQDLKALRFDNAWLVLQCC